MTIEPPDPQPFPTDQDVESVLIEFKNDHREAIRALLHDLDALARDYERDVSKGFVRVAARKISQRR